MLIIGDAETTQVAATWPGQQSRWHHFPSARSAMRLPRDMGMPHAGQRGGLCSVPPGSEHRDHTHRLPRRTTG